MSEVSDYYEFDISSELVGDDVRIDPHEEEAALLVRVVLRRLTADAPFEIGNCVLVLDLSSLPDEVEVWGEDLDEDGTIQLGRLAPDEETGVLLIVRTGVFASTNESQAAAGPGDYGIDAWIRVTYLAPVEEDVAAGPVTVTVAPD